MQHNRSKSKKKKCLETPISGGDILTATLDQLVDYAKNLNDRKEAERMELMCYRLFGHRLTPEAADKIAEIPQRFKKKNKSVLKKIVINKGDKVDKKTVIPRVANYNENVDKQENNYSIPHLNDSEKLKIAE